MKLKLIALALIFLIPIQAYSYNQDIPVDDLNNFVNVYNKIKNEFTGEVDGSDLIKHAIKGMVSSVDEYSQYLVGEEVESMKKSISGNFVGIGVELVSTDYGLQVISPLAGAPAHRAGIRSGDVITSINSVSTRNRNSSGVIGDLVGESKKPVLIEVERNGESIEFLVNKEVINVKSVTSEVRGDIGIVKINIFQRGAYRDFKAEMNKINRADDLSGLIIDLRGNSGGLVEEAVDIADYFTGRGKSLLITERRDGTFNSTSKIDRMFNKPVVVIIDKGSASASEILAGSLRDNKEAVLVGERSFGKGTIQSVSDYENGDVLVMTTATYLTPNGTIIQSNGVEPDIYVGDLLETIDGATGESAKSKVKDIDLYMSAAIGTLYGLINADN